MDETEGTPRPWLARLFPARIAGRAAMLGGLLWLPYGLFTMLQPWGVDVVYDEARGYSVVVDRTLFVVYNLPGSLALGLTSVGLLGIVAQLPRRSSLIARSLSALGILALVLGGASLVGVIAFFDPVFTAGRILGTLVLGLATVLAAVMARRANVGRGWTIGLLLLGAVGVSLLPLWPLVHALGWVMPGQAALFIALFGIGWLAVGHRLLRGADHPGNLPVA